MIQFCDDSHNSTCVFIKKGFSTIKKANSSDLLEQSLFANFYVSSFE